MAVKDLLINTKIVRKDSSMSDIVKFNKVELRSKITYRHPIPLSISWPVWTKNFKLGWYLEWKN